MHYFTIMIYKSLSCLYMTKSQINLSLLICTHYTFEMGTDGSINIGRIYTMQEIIESLKKMAVANPDDADLVALRSQLDDLEALREDYYDSLTRYVKEKLGGTGWGEGTTTVRPLIDYDNESNEPKLFIGRYFGYLRTGGNYFVEDLDDLLAFKSSNAAVDIEEKVERYLGMDIDAHPIQIVTFV